LDTRPPSRPQRNHAGVGHASDQRMGALAAQVADQTERAGEHAARVEIKQSRRGGDLITKRADGIRSHYINAISAVEKAPAQVERNPRDPAEMQSRKEEGDERWLLRRLRHFAIVHWLSLDRISGVEANSISGSFDSRLVRAAPSSSLRMNSV